MCRLRPIGSRPTGMNQRYKTEAWASAPRHALALTETSAILEALHHLYSSAHKITSTPCTALGFVSAQRLSAPDKAAAQQREI